jgi:tetratricopeptide (TPR) repeat protein
MFLRVLFAVALLAQVGVAEARWREASTRHFLIYSEASEADLRHAAEQLERYDSMLRVATVVSDPDRSPATRATIFYVRDVMRVRELAGARNSNLWGFYVPHSSGGMIFSPMEERTSRTRRSNRSPTTQPSDNFTAQSVLLHEYTHHFMFNNFNFGAPRWLSEGYPEFFSTAIFEDDGSITIGTPPWERRHEIQSGNDINAEQILLRPQDNWRVEGIYAIGWLMSHYLTFHPDHMGRELLAYYRALAAGQSPEQAASAFGDLRTLTAELREYRRAGNYNIARVPAERLSTGTISIRELSDGEDAIMEVRMRSKRGVNREQAESLVREARRVAAPYPNDPIVQVSLAEAEYDSRNYDAAEAAADRAIAADPNLVDGHLYKARAIWARAVAADDRRTETWAGIRRIISRANRIDPDDPEPLMLFYQSFGPSGVEPTENAIDALITAHELAPQADDLRFLATREFLRRNQAQRAALAWGPLISGGHGGGNRDSFAEVITLIRAGDSEGALAKIDEMSTQAREGSGESD